MELLVAEDCFDKLYNENVVGNEHDSSGGENDPMGSNSYLGDQHASFSPSQYQANMNQNVFGLGYLLGDSKKNQNQSRSGNDKKFGYTHLDKGKENQNLINFKIHALP